MNPIRRALCWSMVVAAGCTFEPDDIEQEPPLPLQRQTTQPDRPRDPNAPYIDEVIADGSGCPLGTWSRVLGPNSESVVIVFRAYSVSVSSKTEPTQTMNCELAIKLVSPLGHSYAVTYIYGSGMAVLEEGVKGRMAISYGFSGSGSLTPYPPVEYPPPDWRGPYVRPIEFEKSNILTEQNPRAWYPCNDTERYLELRTELSLRRTEAGRTGTLTMNSIEAGASLRIGLKWRPCR